MRTEASVKDKSLRAGLEVLREHLHAVLVKPLPRITQLLAFVADHGHETHEHRSGESQAVGVTVREPADLSAPN